jgi:MYXO-CTERM domain-containing protein
MAAPGDFLVTEYTGNSVVDIAAGGDVSVDSRFATGLAGPLSLCVGPGNDIYVSNFADGTVDIITDGGDFSAVAAFATGLGSAGQLLCSTGIVLVADTAGRIVDATAGGDFSLDQGWAWDDNGTAWSGLIRDGGGNVYTSSFVQGEIYDITGGGDMTDIAAFATGVANATILSDSGAGLLVVQGLLDPIKDFSAGGNISGDAPWAEVPRVVSVYDRGGDGIWALGQDPSSETGAAWDVTAGGDFELVAPYAWGIDSLGLAAGGMLYHVCAVDNDCDDGDVCNGDETCGLNACIGGLALDCDDEDECTSDSCDSVLGCQHDPVGGCGEGTTTTGEDTGTGTASDDDSTSSGGSTTTGGFETTTAATGNPDTEATTMPDPPTGGGPGGSSASASGSGATSPSGSGSTGGSDTDGTDEDAASDEGCGCRAQPTQSGAALVLLLLWARRRRHGCRLRG